jgi:hypothetical protein
MTRFGIVVCRMRNGENRRVQRPLSVTVVPSIAGKAPGPASRNRAWKRPAQRRAGQIGVSAERYGTGIRY